jgi:predicted Zn-dependent protease
MSIDMTRTVCLSICFSLSTLLAPLSYAQSAAKTPPGEPPSSVDRALTLAQEGQCTPALPLLRSAHPTERQMKRRVGLATVKCALKLDEPAAAVSALLSLNRDFPHDPEVLYITTHAYSDLATRASQELARSAPNSYPAQELYAESLEMQGKWDEAEAEYRKILAAHPELPGIHYRLGRLILSKPPTATTASDASKEFEEELKLDPKNPDAEYILGELARQSSHWGDAIDHLSRAVKLDPRFSAAYLGLGMSLNSAGKFADSLAPLERYVRLEPNDPAGHYQLAIACARSGRREEAEKEMARQRELVNKSRETQGKEAQGPGEPR